MRQAHRRFALHGNARPLDSLTNGSGDSRIHFPTCARPHAGLSKAAQELCDAGVFRETDGRRGRRTSTLSCEREAKSTDGNKAGAAHADIHRDIAVSAGHHGPSGRRIKIESRVEQSIAVVISRRQRDFAFGADRDRTGAHDDVIALSAAPEASPKVVAVISVSRAASAGLVVAPRQIS